MKTKNYIRTTLVVSILLMAAALAACTPTAVAAPQTQPIVEDVADTAVLAEPAVDMTTVDDQGNTSIDAGNLQSNLTIEGELTEDEISGLTFMREEEKLARDVYDALYGYWGLAIFQNIADSEQTHMDSVKVLLDAYGLADPTEGKNLGEFANQDLQDLYNTLVERGSQSISDALKVGAAIEEIDIIDLENHLAETENAAIITVYENLMKGSRNHLRSFVSTLFQQTGENYEPQYLTTDVYQSIVGSGIESGGNSGRNENSNGFGNGNGNGGGNRP